MKPFRSCNSCLRSVSRQAAVVFLAAGFLGLITVDLTQAESRFLPDLLGDSLTTQYLSAGADHSCGVKQEGGIFCWGRNDSGQSTVPGDFFTSNDDFEQVSTGAFHTCGLRDDGSISCWGADASGQSTVPAPNTAFTQVSAGAGHTCGRKSDGSIVCWGDNAAGQLDVPLPNSGYSRVSAGGSHTCARRTDGTLVCWGLNSAGQLDIPASNSGFTQVAAGMNHTCGVKTDATVVCWGADVHGQSTVPVPNAQFYRVSAGFMHTCGLKGDGSIVCWGSNANGESTVPLPNSAFVQVAAGNGHSCGMKIDGEVLCWGSNAYYESDPFTAADIFRISAGRYHTCLLREGNSIFCWGRNEIGQSNSPYPNNSFVEVGAGEVISCGRTSGGSIVCWGSNYYNESTVPSPNSNFLELSVGYRHACGVKSDGSISCTSDFIWGDPPPPNNDFIRVGAGGEHTCGVTSGQEIICWGTNTDGQTTVPAPSTAYIQVGAGRTHTCGQNLIAGPIQCWGSNSNGQTSVPLPNNNFESVSAGDRHSCGIQYNLSSVPSVICWGDNSSGQLNVPFPNSRYVRVSAGGSHTCGLRMDNFFPFGSEAKCWGDDTYGQSSLALTKFRIPPVNQPPTANDDSYTVLEDTLLSVPAAGVLANDTDPENDPLTALEAAPTGSGLLALAADGSFEYTPGGDYCGGDYFTYRARTPLADSNIATAVIGVTCVNDAPSFNATDPPAAGEDAGPQSVAGWAAFSPGPANESAQGVQQYIVSNVSNPALFAAGPAVTAAGTLTYTPAANASGSSTFNVTVQDNGGTANGGVDTSVLQTFTITVNPVNDAPTTSGLGNLNVTEDSLENVIDLWPCFDDLEDTDDQLAFSITSNSNPGLFQLAVIDADRNLLMAFTLDANGASDIVVRATDTGGLWVESTLHVTVTPVNDAPSFAIGGDVVVPVNSVAYSGAWAGGISPGPPDEAGQALTFQILSNDNAALFSSLPSIAPDGTLSFTSAPGTLGTANLSVQLQDDGGTANGGVDTSPVAYFSIIVAPSPGVMDVMVNIGGAPIPPGGTILTPVFVLTVVFTMDVDNPAGNTDPDDVTNPGNYLLFRPGANAAFDTVDCAGGLAGDDVGITVGPVSYSNATFTALVSLNGGAMIPNGQYRLLVCGTTSITSGGIALAGDGTISGTDYALDFTVAVPASLPATGFAPDVLTNLPEQPGELAYASIGGMQLQIPRLGVILPVVGVPFRQGTWDVTWLGWQAGWLEGTAFPTWSGNSVVTAHVVGADGLPGPFWNLGDLVYGDTVHLNAWGQQYVYEVRSVRRVWADSIDSVFRHETYPWLTLLTCKGYDPGSDSYRYRTVVRAVQVAIR